jgi:CRP/FNR family transcriptional regulator, cyclic AMP receptor protein
MGFLAMTDLASDILDTVRLNRIFSSIEGARLAAMVQTRKIARGDVAVGLGSHGQSLLIVHSGWFTQRATHHLGAELILSILGRGDCIGIPELILSMPTEAETVAGTDSTLLSIPWWAVNELCSSVPEFRTAIERELARELLLRRSRLTTFAFSTLEGRIADFLLDIERIARCTPGFRLTQGMIAGAVGASRPKVNRCLKALERRGVVALHNGAIPEIRSRDALVGVL